MDGAGLDLFSGYAVGGLTGDYPVGGYYRNEFRARRAAVVDLNHDFVFAEDRIVSIGAQAARLRELNLELPGHRPRTRTLAGLGIGYFHGIRGLGGLPVILRYFEGLLIPENSAEGHRREFLVIVAAGF